MNIRGGAVHNGIDETLLLPRQVLRSAPDDEGLGYSLELTCGHTVWTAVAPPFSSVCGMCLNTLMDQIREVQARQRLE